jgi:hypothetical protein
MGSDDNKKAVDCQEYNTLLVFSNSDVESISIRNSIVEFIG